MGVGSYLLCVEIVYLQGELNQHSVIVSIGHANMLDKRICTAIFPSEIALI